MEKNSPASTAVNTPRTSHPSDFLFIVGGNVLNQSLDFLGVLAQVEPTLLGYETFPNFQNYPMPPIAKSLIELVFETSKIDVIKLEAIHAVHRHLVTNDPIGGKYFCFTINSKSVIEKSHDSIYFCHCFETVEVMPLSRPWEGYAGIVPVVYCLVSPSSSIEDYEENLKNFAKSRKKFMQSFWSGGKIDYSFDSDFHHLDPTRTHLDDSSSEQLINHTIPLLLSTVSSSMILGVFAAAIFDKRVIIVSYDRIKRSNFVLGLYVLMDRIFGFKYPHPCLGIVPISIASELVNAPTPLIAAVSRKDKSSSRKNKRNQDCVFVDIDKGCEDANLSQLGCEHFPLDLSKNYEFEIDKISDQVRSRIEFFVAEIIQLTHDCLDFPSAVAAIAQQQSPILTSFFNSSTIQLLLSERGGAAWLDHCL